MSADITDEVDITAIHVSDKESDRVRCELLTLFPVGEGYGPTIRRRRHVAMESGIRGSGREQRQQDWITARGCIDGVDEALAIPVPVEENPAAIV